MLTLQSSLFLTHLISYSMAYVLVVMLTGYLQALIAKKLGDPTAEHGGFLTLNPLVYVDVSGYLLFLFLGFGWGHPVPINPSRFKGKYHWFELIFAYASRAVAAFVLSILLLFLLVAFLGGFSVSTALPSLLEQHFTATQTLRLIIMTMIHYSISFAIFSFAYTLFRSYMTGMRGSGKMHDHHAEQFFLLSFIFLFILFRTPFAYIMTITLMGIEALFLIVLQLFGK